MTEKKITLDDQINYHWNFLTDNGSLYLVNCAQCKRENYAAAVSSGTCAWCGWSAPKNLELME